MMSQEESFTAFRSIPLLGGAVPITGHWPEVAISPLAFFSRANRTSTIIRASFFRYRALVTTDPDVIQHILQNSPKQYIKSRNYDGIKQILGDGLVTSEGTLWRRQRMLAQPAFHAAKLRALTPRIAAAAQTMLAAWSAWPDGHRFDFHAEMMKLTLRIAGSTLLDVGLEHDERAIGEAVTIANAYANEVVLAPYRLPLWVPTPHNRRIREALETLDGIVYRIIRERREDANQEQRDDVLSLLMTTSEDGQTMSDRQLRDEVMTFILAGHETTANAMTWTATLLAEHPEWAARVAREAEEVLGDRTPTYDDLPNLKITERVVQEAMRLYPPVWAIEREPKSREVAGGYEIPEEVFVVIPIYVLHRNPKFWPNPERFDPDRFLPENARDRPRCAYLPFGDGPRVCIGKAFALIESKIMLSMMSRRMKFELAEAHPPRLEPLITLRPKHGLRMRYRPCPERMV